jgi:hypothetical protein
VIEDLAPAARLGPRSNGLWENAAMARGGKVRGLLTPLQEAISDRLLAAGWSASDGQAAEGADLGRFVRPLGGGFLATAIFPWWQNARSGTVSVVARLGIDYEPARDLLVLAGSAASGLVLKEPVELVRLSSPGEVASPADRLVRVALENASALADIADVDTLIEMLREDRAVPFMDIMMVVYAGEVADSEPGEPVYPSAEPELIPALLAGAGRHEEARRALASSVAQNRGQPVTPNQPRLSRRLERLAGSDGALPPPTTLPGWRSSPNAVGADTVGGRRRSLAQGYKHARAEREAIDAVRATRSNDDADELKARLESELEARGVEMEPFRIADTVNVLVTERKSFGTLRLFRNLARDVANLASSAARGDFGEPSATPDWLKPPDRAAYPVLGFTDTWTAVELDPAAEEWLERVWRGQPGVGSTREVTVWLNRDRSPPDSGLALNVHVGPERVGRIPGDAVGGFRAVLEAAAERDEDPWTRARLTTTSTDPRFLLEVQVPVGDG